MSRWATQRSAIVVRLGHAPDMRRASPALRWRTARPGSSMADRCSRPLLARPDLPDAAESERPCGGLVEVPITTADVWPAVVDSRGHRTSAIAAGDLGSTWKRSVRDARPGVETAACVPPVVVPGGLGQTIDGHMTGAGRRTAVQRVSAEADA